MNLDDGLEIFDIVPESNIDTNEIIMPEIKSSNFSQAEQSDIYVNIYKYEDLGVSDMVFNGFLICGIGLLVSLGLAVCLSMLRRG